MDTTNLTELSINFINQIICESIEYLGGRLKFNSLVYSILSDDSIDLNELFNKFANKISEIINKSLNIEISKENNNEIINNVNDNNNQLIIENNKYGKRAKIKLKTVGNLNENENSLIDIISLSKKNKDKKFKEDKLYDENPTCTVTLNDLNFGKEQKKDFERILDKLKIKNSVYKLLTNREFYKINQLYKVTRDKINGRIIYIPSNENKCIYKYRFKKNHNRPSYYLHCLEPNCKGKGKLFKENLKFTIVENHTCK